MTESAVIPYETMLNALTLQLALVDASGKVVWANDSWLRFNRGSDGVLLPGIGHLFREGWERAAQAGDVASQALIEGVERFLARQESELYLEYCRRRIGEERWFLVRGAMLERAYSLLWHVDITTRKLSELRALHQANNDHLTSVRNRSAIFRRLETLISSSPGRFAIAIADIDELKRINDSVGHQQGDRAIVRVARALDRSSVEVGRIGGDEFLVIFPRLHTRLASTYSSQVARALAESRTSLCTVSLGFAYYPRDGQTAGELVGTADRRMYLAKARRRAALSEAA
jgi:diguanylate cyclase (GGDEF)-like protein